MADLDPDSLNKLKVVDLREHLSNRGLSTTGLKAELVKRLKTALLSEEQSQDGDHSQNLEEDTEEDESSEEDVEAQLRAEENARFRAEEEARLKVEEEASLKAEEEARFKAEEEARLKAKEEARLKAKEEARLKAKEEARLKAKEEARLKAEEEARLKAEEKARLKAEKEARLRAEEEARQMAEEEKRQKAEEEARQEARRRAKEEARLREAEEERQRAEVKARLRAQEEARQRAQEEARQRAQEEARQRAEQEAKQRAEEKARQRAEEEAKRRAEEEAKRRAEEEAKRRAEEEAKRRAEEEAKRRAEEETKLKTEEEARKRAEEERQRMLDEEKKRKEEENRLAEEKRIKHLAAEIEKKRAEEIRIREEQRKVEEEEMRLEQERWLVEEQMRKAQEEHKKRVKADQEKRKLELEKQRKHAEEQNRKAEEQRLAEKKAEEQRLAEKKAEEQRLAEKKAEEQRLAEKKAVEQRLAEKKAEEQRILAIKQAEEQRLEEERKQKEVELQQMSLQSNNIQNELPFQDVSSGMPITLQMPPVPPFYSMAAVNIMPPPPTVLMSTIPPLLPPGTLPPNTHPSMMPIIPPPPINSESENVEIIESMDTGEDSEIKLPQALEKVLALKSERAQLLGVDPDTVLQTSDEKASTSKSSVVTLVSIDEDEYIEIEENDSAMKHKESRNRRRKKKKKKRQTKNQDKADVPKRSEKWSERDSGIDVDIEYVQEVIDISDPLYSSFMKIFEKFKLTDNEKENEVNPDGLKNVKEEMFNPMAYRKKPVDLDDDDDDDDDDNDDDRLEEEKPKLSKRKLKKLSRMTVAELKQKVSRPELVEMHDVTAKDPVLLLHLKASRNTVPVPRHWCFKRKYLQGKRGIEKPAFELPDFIKRTGIMEMRQALQEKEDQKTMKAKMRERARPKLGKIDIDYQKLHDAFFKWQTKPKMTIHGDIYYEGKEFETRLKEKKPGDLSEDLRTALGMPTGPNANKCPPPWLIAMQRYGPPPSYPNLKIPGLNAPIPDGCSFGYHAGGWGKPPVDETGRPLYGDVFGTQVADNQPHIQEEEIDHTLWGELESESSEEEEEDEEEEEEDEEEKTEDETGLVTPAEGLITPSGFSSIPAGMETPDMIELRKRKIEAEMEGGETPALYTILPEKKTERVGAAMMGSTHIYDLAAAIPGSKLRAPGTSSVPPQGIEVALDPSELEMDTAAMAARYEQTMREQQSQLEKEDLSDMVAEHAARQKNKRKKQQLDSAKPPKKYKEFKF